MPIINIEFDNEQIKNEEIENLCKRIRKIEDVSVYANSSQIKVSVLPVEIFIKMSAHKIKDEEFLCQSAYAENLAL